MNIVRYIKPLFLSLIIFVASPAIRAETVNSPEIFQAAEVAYRDFSAKLNQDAGGARDGWKYASYVANIRNYNIGISESDKYYVVVFSLKKSAANIKGGGGKYKIYKGDLKIIEFLGYT